MLDFKRQNQVVGIEMLGLSKRAPRLNPQALEFVTVSKVGVNPSLPQRSKRVTVERVCMNQQDSTRASNPDRREFIKAGWRGGRSPFCTDGAPAKAVADRAFHHLAFKPGDGEVHAHPQPRPDRLQAASSAWAARRPWNADTTKAWPSRSSSGRSISA